MSDNELKQAALEYHRQPAPGKLRIEATTDLETQRDLALAYSPGVAYACEAIAEDPSSAAELTARANLVAIVTNGSAVLGLGNIGALAAKPVMEGKSVLLKRFSGIDAFDIELEASDPDDLIHIIKALEPTFGGIILEDIKAPECFAVEAGLRAALNVPVFHDDQHGTAVVSTAAVIAWLRLQDKKISDVRLAINGAGSASMACANLLISFGLPRENIVMCDSSGVIHSARNSGMNEFKSQFAIETEKRSLSDALEGADIFFGLSVGNCVTQEMVAKMNPDPLILAMANPDPEIKPELAREVWSNAVIGTGRSDYPNQVNNVLCFPFLFRGALDCGATEINEEMKIACANALVELAMQESTPEVAKVYAGEELSFGPEYIIPKPFDSRLITTIPVAVAEAAMKSGVASRPIKDLKAYRKTLELKVTKSGFFMQSTIEAARGKRAKLVFAEGECSDVLHAVQNLVDEKIVNPVLVGRPERIEESIARLGLRLKTDEIEIIDPASADVDGCYYEAYLSIAGRRGIDEQSAKAAVRQNSTVLAALVARERGLDGVICGLEGRYNGHLHSLLDVIGPIAGKRVSSASIVLLPSGPVFLTDCFIGVDPDEDEIVSKTTSAIELVNQFGIAPKVALLSHSNFGTSRAPEAAKMRKATEKLRQLHPRIEIDGEMHVKVALDADHRESMFRFAELRGPANVLVFPNLDAANIALELLQTAGNALLIGPFLSGMQLPAHVLMSATSARGIFNVAALTALKSKNRN